MSKLQMSSYCMALAPTPDMLLLGCLLVRVGCLFDVLAELALGLVPVDGARREVILEAWPGGRVGVGGREASE